MNEIKQILTQYKTNVIDLATAESRIIGIIERSNSNYNNSCCDFKSKSMLDHEFSLFNRWKPDDLDNNNDRNNGDNYGSTIKHYQD